MKKILFVLAMCILSVHIQAQVFDEPIDSTEHYNFRLYAQSARVPAEILNDDKSAMDSIIYSLIVWTDSTQFRLVLDTAVTTTHLTFKISNYATGQDSFVTTATVDTFTVLGSDTLTEADDFFFISVYGTPNANDNLGYTVLGDDKVIVSRPASGSSGLKYKWRWIRRY